MATSTAMVSPIMHRLERKAKRMLAPTNIQIGGDRPWDIQVHDPRLFARVLAKGSLGLGEAYMDGWWDAECLDEFFVRLIRAGLDDRLAVLQKIARRVFGHLMNLQSRRLAFRVGERHYDLGNDLFEHMLGQWMAYSCAYWQNAATLDDAQEAKLDLVCRKLELEPGMRLLDIGCGWGVMAKFAAERYGTSVVGITVSRQQAEYARRLCQELPVEIRVEDYRAHQIPHKRYDRIVSIGMFEHVGFRNYRTYMRLVRDLMVSDGLFLLRTIGGNTSLTRTDPWIEKYIFPNSMMPSPRQITHAAERLFAIENWYDFSADYDRTLMAWQANFEHAWPELSVTYGERFHRMWRFYLMVSAASFRTYYNRLFQIVFSPENGT